MSRTGLGIVTAVAAVVGLLAAVLLVNLLSAPVQGDTLVDFAGRLRGPAWVFIAILVLLIVAAIVALARIIPALRRRSGQ